MPHSSFELIRSQRIDSINIEAREYRHIKTGARHLHLGADDRNNVFSVAFLTVPQDSTGVAHILEHTTLCGSRRFPVRDPFFMMLRRTLSTFMNAFTSSDWTAYPFATQNRKDFDNLLRVYLDAVFFPRLDELDFAQEGHRAEFRIPDDPSTELVYKGVVYNEMKGAMSSPHARLWQALCSELFPTTTYRYNSGGEPAEIPNLTYGQLKAFHTKHYHPSNAFLTTYGDFPEDTHQHHFHEWALKEFEAHKIDLRIPDEQRLMSPRSVEVRYAVDDQDNTAKRTHIVIGWLLEKTTDLTALMHMQLLAGVLLDNSASPLQHALEATPLGSSPSELNGLGTSTREASFVCGIEGTDPEHAVFLEQLVFKVITDVAKHGVATTDLASVLHHLELAQREIPGGQYPYGLRLMETAMPTALHGGDPIAALDIDRALRGLREEIRDPNFIKALTRRLLLDNPHRVRVVMRPDPSLSSRKTRLERERLEDLKRSMNTANKSRIVAQATALASRQQTQLDPSVLPKVGLEDVPTELRIPEGHAHGWAGLPVTWFEAATNGLVYEQIIVSLPDLHPEEVQLLGLYCDCLTELGIGERNYLEVQTWQAAVSGGISASCSVCGEIDNVQHARAFVRIEGSGLERNHAGLAELLKETLQAARFDETERLQELIAQNRAYREAAVTDHGHMLALAAACAGMSSAGAINDQWNGLMGLRQLKALDEELQEGQKRAEFAVRLAKIHEKIKNSPFQLLMVGEQRELEKYVSQLEVVWRDTPNEHSHRKQLSLQPLSKRMKQGWATSTQVNFCARAYPTVPADHQDAPALTVLGRFLHNGYLHTAIREQGGAYGSGAAYDSNTGAFHFYSYRDPRLDGTLEDFDRSLEWLAAHRHDAEKIEEAIIGVISAIDRPGSPASEAITAFLSMLNGRTPEHRQRFRQKVLGVNVDDLRRVSETYLTPDRASTAVISDAQTLEDHVHLGLSIQRL